MSEDRGEQTLDEGDDLELDDDLGEGGDDEAGELDESEGGEPAGEGEEPEAGEREPPPQRQPSRAERRIAALRKERREQAEEIKRLRAVQEQALTQTRQPAPQPDPYRQAEQQRQEAEWLALQPPDVVARHVANQALQPLQQQMARQQVEFADRLDRQSFDSFAASRPAAQRMAAAVERTLAEARQGGMNPTRQAVYHLLLGRQVDERASRQIAQQRKTGQRRIASQRTTGAAPRSNAPAQRRGRADDSDEALIARLKNTTVGDVW